MVELGCWWDGMDGGWREGRAPEETADGKESLMR